MGTIPEAAVLSWLRLKASDDDIKLVIPAVEAYVNSLPVSTAADGTVLASWPKEVELAAVMLAARMHRRRNSPGGVEAVTEGGVSYVARYDSDIARLLKIDGYQKPQVG